MATSSYRQILKSSALIGGSSFINILFSVVRTKVLAVFIGTEGIGLFGALSSVTSLVSGISGLGISNSGVRQIAAAVGSQDQNKISRTTVTLRWTAIGLGFVGMLGLMLFSCPIARATFGDNNNSAALALLSVTILFTAVAGAQTALIQGFRRISDLAALSIWSAVLGTLFSIPIVLVFREKGIVPFLVVVSALSVATSWWYVRKIKIEHVQLSAAALWEEAKSLLGMGLVFMASSVMVSGVAYCTRVMVIRQLNIEAAGLYQAAWTISSVYVGFVLTAMGADYFPRLTSVSGDDTEVNRLVNEQTEAALLMAVPGLLATLTFAPWVIQLLYSSEFEPAVQILRWQILGILGRVISWPIGFVLLAKGRSKTFFCTELASNLVHLGLIWLGLRWFGLTGLGIAFFGLYVFCGLLVLLVVHNLSGFWWTRSNLRLCGVAILLTICAFFLTTYAFPKNLGVVIGSIMTTVAGLLGMKKMVLRAGYAGLTDAWEMVRARLKARST